MLFYLPLESYPSRYTMQWSAPKTGWLERRWLAAGIPYRRVDGDFPVERKEIKAGCVLDAVGRSTYCFSQISKLLALAEAGELTDSDCVFFDDFWTPGFEALPYAFQLLGVKPKMYAFLHAQSVDEFDFTFDMRAWMRHFERGIAESLSGIFVAAPVLKDLVCFGGIAPRSKVHTVGMVFNSDEVMERMPSRYRESREECTRLNQVVFSSRWDWEKNPDLFLKVVDAVLTVRQDVKFVICSGFPRIRSNRSSLLDLLDQYRRKYPTNVLLRDGLTKEQYYEVLTESKIQMSTASQDFVSITLLEGSVAGCYPIYPFFRSFPEALQHRQEFFYEMFDVDHAAHKILQVLSRNDLWTETEIVKRSWIHTRYDATWARMAKIMGLADFEVEFPYEDKYRG